MVRVMGIVHPPGREEEYNGTDLTKKDIDNIDSLMGLPIFDNHDYKKVPIGHVAGWDVDKKGRVWMVSSEIDEALPHGKRVVDKIKSKEYEGLSLGTISEADERTQTVDRYIAECSICPGKEGHRKGTKIKLVLARKGDGDEPETVDMDLTPIDNLMFLPENASPDFPPVGRKLMDKMLEESQTFLKTKFQELIGNFSFISNDSKTNTQYEPKIQPTAEKNTTILTEGDKSAHNSSKITEQQKPLLPTRSTKVNITKSLSEPPLSKGKEKMDEEQERMNEDTEPQDEGSALAENYDEDEEPSEGEGDKPELAPPPRTQSGSKAPPPGFIKTPTQKYLPAAAQKQPGHSRDDKGRFTKKPAQEKSVPKEKSPDKGDSAAKELDDFYKRYESSVEETEINKSTISRDALAKMHKEIKEKDRITKENEELQKRIEKLEKKYRKEKKNSKHNEVNRILKNAKSTIKILQELAENTSEDENKQFFDTERKELERKIADPDALHELPMDDIQALHKRSFLLTRASQTFNAINAKREGELAARIDAMQAQMKGKSYQSGRKRTNPETKNMVKNKRPRPVGGMHYTEYQKKNGEKSKHPQKNPKHSPATPKGKEPTTSGPTYVRNWQPSVEGYDKAISMGVQPFYYGKLCAEGDQNSGIFEEIERSVRTKGSESFTMINDSWIKEKEWYDKTYNIPCMPVAGFNWMPAVPAFKKMPDIY